MDTWLYMLPLAAALAFGVVRLCRRAAASDRSIAGRLQRVLLVCLAPLTAMPLLSFAGAYANAAACALLLLSGFLSYRVVGCLILRHEDSGRINAAAERNFSIQEQSCAVLSKYMQEVRTARHDLRHHLYVIERYIAGGDREGLKEYIAGMGGSAALESSLSVCGHFAADAVSRHYLDIARQAGAKLDIELDIPANIGIPSADICVVLGNLMENAVEAIQKTRQGERFIRVRSQNTESSLTLVVGNPYAGALERSNGLFRSAKQPAHEGLGLSSVRAVAEKYNGAARFEAKGGLFTASIILFKPEENPCEL